MRRKIAIEAADNAIPAWAAMPAVEKAKLFLRAAENVRRRRDEIAEILARETGSTIPFSTFQHGLVAATPFEHYGESADAKTLFREFGFTPEAVLAAAERSLAN
jgi:acyl-CoA reductase-like NAD-dependent aldehyde dehydrogenase